MKKVYLLLFLVLLATSCAEKEKQSVAEKNLENGYVFVDGTKQIIHWDENCKRVYKDIMLIEKTNFFRYRNVEFCSCVPSEIADSILSKMKK